MAIVDSPERFEIGRVVSRTFSVLSRNAGMFLSLSALLMIPMLFLGVYMARESSMAIVAGAAGGKLALANLEEYIRTARSRFWC